MLPVLPSFGLLLTHLLITAALWLEVKVEACKVQVAKPSSVVIAVVLFNLTAVFFTEMKPQAFVT